MRVFIFRICSRIYLASYYMVAYFLMSNPVFEKLCHCISQGKHAANGRLKLAWQILQSFSVRVMGNSTSYYVQEMS